MIRKEPKHITRFLANAKVVNPDVDTKKEAFASLKALKQLMPEGFDPTQDPDLLYIASPLVLVGKCNLNGDCITKETAVKNYEKFAKRLLDVEHDREKIVGNIFVAKLTELDTNRILTPEEAMEKDLFNISYGAYIWVVANPKLAEFISMASDESSKYYNSISSSFEIGFDEYKIAVGSTTLSEAKILSQEEAVAYEKFLRANGGAGVDDNGIPVYRVIGDDMAPRGAGLVSRPASQVKGVITLEDMLEDMEEEDCDDDEEGKCDDDKAVIAAIEELKQFIKSGKTFDEFIEIKSKEKKEKEVSASETKILENNNIQKKESGVINNTNPMKLKTLADIDSNKAELFKNEAFATDIAALIEAETAKISEKYSKELQAKAELAEFLEKAKADAENKVKELEARAEQLQTSVSELADKLNKIEEAKAAEIAEKAFNERMAGLDEEFELDEDARSFVAEDIKGMTDEQFTSYAKKASVLFKKKEKKMEKEEKKEVSASEAVANVKEEGNNGIPNGTPPVENLKERMAKAFSKENIKINGKQLAE